MSDRPTLYLTNWGSRKHHGPGRKLTIMARPRAWEHGEGSVKILLPDAGALVAVKAGTLPIDRYLADYRDDLAHAVHSGPNLLTPRALFAFRDGVEPFVVADGDTLLCACAVGAPCHRREAAPFLVRAGWRVVLDGEPFAETGADEGRSRPMSLDLLTVADLALRFGRVNRATYHPDGERPETDTDHTVMLAILACELGSQIYQRGGDPLWPSMVPSLDVGKLAQLALVHDLVEAEAGDTNTLGGLTPESRREKEARETAALASLRVRLGDGWTVQAIECYERQDTAEARFLRYLDKVTPKLTQALNGGAQIRRAGRDVAWLHARHRAQGTELAERYPEWAPVLGPIFDAACEAAERALAEATGTDGTISTLVPSR